MTPTQSHEFDAITFLKSYDSDKRPLWAQEQLDIHIATPKRAIPADYFCTHAPMTGKQVGAKSLPLQPSDLTGWAGNGYRLFGGMPPCNYTPEHMEILGAGTLQWGGVEYVKGEWKWDMTDAAVGVHAQHLRNLPAGLLVNLKGIPPWAAKNPESDGLVWAPFIYRGSSSLPKNLKDWENYVARLATRYKGHIQYYETPNEPNHEMKLNPWEIVENNRVVYETVKRINPKARVVGPATAGTPTMAEWTGEYMAKGGNAITDVVTCHFYGQPEAIPYMYAKVRRELMRAGAGNKVVWNTESGFFADNAENGGPDKNVESRRAKIARSFILQWAVGIKRWYVFGDVNEARHKQAIQQSIAWLSGATMKRCEVKNQIWECECVRNSKLFLLVWAGPKYPHQLDEKLDYPKDALFNVPSGYRTVETLSGEKTEITAKSVAISPTPIRLS